MAWYYVKGEEQVGPLDDAQFKASQERGEILAETLVWREGMPKWDSWSNVSGGAATVATVAPVPQPAQGMTSCAECGGMFSAEDMVRYGDSFVCAKCKPVFFQRLREGAALPGVMKYAGFWIRFCALFVDGIILAMIGTALGFTVGAFLGATRPEPDSTFPAAILALQGIVFVIRIAYFTVFVGMYGATPGKMACGLRIVRADGSKVTYLRAFARFWASGLSALILLIGFLMVAFDSERRALHDRICDTRVIRK